MYRRRSQIFWYALGGFFLILAGVFYLAGVTYLYALPILLVAAGIIIILASLLGHRPALSAAAVFLLGIVILGLVVSSSSGLGRTTTEIYQLTTAEAPSVDEIQLACTVSTGSLHLSFTTNASLIYRIVFNKNYFLFIPPTVSFNKSVANGRLNVNAAATTASVEIILSQAIRSSFNLTTSTGSIRVEVPPTASQIRNIRLTTTTGQVWANITNTSNLQSLVETTTTGQVEALITSSRLNRDCSVQLGTTTGQVVLNLQLIGVQSKISASTNLGRVNAANVIGFTPVNPTTQTSYVAQTSGYNIPSIRKLTVTTNTNTGNVDLTANYSPT